jgi:hypothetical protein
LVTFFAQAKKVTPAAARKPSAPMTQAGEWASTATPHIERITTAIRGDTEPGSVICDERPTKLNCELALVQERRLTDTRVTNEQLCFGSKGISHTGSTWPPAYLA